MSKRAKIWAHKTRERLTALLGGRCVWCGATTELTFDCILPQGHEHHGWSTDKRMTFYRRQAALCNLQILCHHCNSRKQAGKNPPYLPPVPGRGFQISMTTAPKIFSPNEPDQDLKFEEIECPF